MITDNKSSSLLLARIISRISEPIFYLPVIIWLVLRHVDIPREKQMIYYSGLLLFVFVIPFAYFFYMVFIERKFDIDITERAKRVTFTLKSMISFTVAVVLTFFMDKELFIITLAVWISTLGLILITLKWKISFHGGLNALIFSTANYLYDWEYWWLYLLLIPIGWARLEMKKHSLAQFVAGVSLCISVFWLVISAL